MPPSVKVLDIDKAKKEVKNCPLIVRQYVKALDHIIEIQKQTIEAAIKKLREKGCNKCHKDNRFNKER